MESEKINIIINREEIDGSNIVELVIEELNNIAIRLTDNNVDDIEKFFNSIFMKVIENEKLVEFNLEDSINDLFKEVAYDIVMQINSEIKQSESDFEKIIELSKK